MTRVPVLTTLDESRHHVERSEVFLAVGRLVGRAMLYEGSKAKAQQTSKIIQGSYVSNVDGGITWVSYTPEGWTVLVAVSSPTKGLIYLDASFPTEEEAKAALQDVIDLCWIKAS